MSPPPLLLTAFLLVGPSDASAQPSAGGARVRVGETVSGTLSTADAARSGHGVCRRYAFSVEANARVVLDAKAGARYRIVAAAAKEAAG